MVFSLLITQFHTDDDVLTCWGGDGREKGIGNNAHLFNHLFSDTLVEDKGGLTTMWRLYRSIVFAY